MWKRRDKRKEKVKSEQTLCNINSYTKPQKKPMRKESILDNDSASTSNQERIYGPRKLNMSKLRSGNYRLGYMLNEYGVSSTRKTSIKANRIKGISSTKYNDTATNFTKHSPAHDCTRAQDDDP